MPQRSHSAYNELLVAYRGWEVAIERDPEVVRVVALVGYDMLQKRSLMPQNLCEARAVDSNVNRR